jgi:hypothetical protein
MELGLGLFIDRPLGYAKASVEPDLTPILAHEAFSPSLGRRRVQELARITAELGLKPVDVAETETPLGLPHRELAECPRPVAALADVRKVADDFVIVRTLPGGLNELLRLFDWHSLHEQFRLRFLLDSQVLLCVQTRSDSGPVLTLFDDQMRRRVEMHVDASEGYIQRAGVELPRAGLVVTRVWNDRSVDSVSVQIRISATEAFAFPSRIHVV